MTRSLAVDLGGTHIRFRLLEDGARPAPVHVIEANAVTSFEHAVEWWREQAGVREALDAIGVAAAGPVEDGTVRITNLDWSLDARGIEHTCNARRCLLVNDVTAIAWALPSLGGGDVREFANDDSDDRTTDGDSESAVSEPCADRDGDAHESDAGGPDEVRRLGSGGPTARTTRAVIAPGTGLGISGLVPNGAEDFAAIEGEGGHQTLAAQSPREWTIVAALAERFGHASAERALSGPGIEAIWWALASIDGVCFDRGRTAAEIAQDAFTHSDPVAEEAIAMFTGFLGSVAGNLALTLGARGGVYIAGGIVPGWGERFDTECFLDRFRAKGRFRGYLSAIPVGVVTHLHPGLVGVEHLLMQRMST